MVVCYFMKTILLGIILFFFNSTLLAQIRTSNKSIGMTISFPWINNYSYFNYDTKKSTSKNGFIGFGFALFYSKDKNKLSLNYGVTSDFPTVVILPIEYVSDSPRTAINSFFIDLLLHHQFYKKFNCVGGVNFTNYHFNFISAASNRPSFSKNNQTIGMTIGTEYSFSKHFSIAILYRPGICPSEEKIYRHVLSLDFRFDINFWKN